MTQRELKLIGAMRQRGYDCGWNVDGKVIIVEIPLKGLTSGIRFPMFRSVQAAADWLIPILRDDSFSEAVNSFNP